MSAVVAGFRAFREEFVTSASQIEIGNYLNGANFDSFEARRLRYEILWAYYGNDIYRNIHNWATTYKTVYGLYRYIRNIYNPAYRLGEFYRSHIWGGQLDPNAGIIGAIPIIAEDDNDPLREAISQIWLWSNWAVNKDVVPLWGSVMGDVFIKVRDDTNRVYFDIVHPGSISEVVKDVRGNIRGYTIEELRPDPETGRAVTYREEAFRENQDIIFKTYLNNALHAWNGIAAEWSEPYGFVPMVHVLHNNVGLDWGWSELHPARSKIHELDDLASMLSDQIRKTINAKWLFTGIKKDSSGNVDISGVDATAARPDPGREETAALYTPNPDAKAQALVAQLDIEGAIAHISEILKELERDYTELRFDNLRASGTVSGVALRVARQPAETKVIQRRASYDDALVRAQQMAVSIAGFRGLNPFNLDSYDQGQLDHMIGPRPVFALDKIEELEADKLFWENAQIARDAGAALKGFLEDEGWSEERIAAVVSAIQQE